MQTRRDFILASGAALLAASPLAARADWHDKVKVLRMGFPAEENAGDQLARFADTKAWLEKKLGVPVKIIQTSDYAGIMQAFAAHQLDISPGVGAQAYAETWLDTNGGVEPLLTVAEEDGSLGYYSLLYVRADSPFKTVDDLKGKSIAFADPNSTSGFLVPSAEFRLMGKDPRTFFGKTSFGGGHEQTVIAVLKGQYDAGFTWSSGQGNYNDGYSRGAFHSMVENGLLKMSDLRVIWRSHLIPNGPLMVQADMPADLKARLTEIFMGMKAENPKMYSDFTLGNGQGFVKVDQSFYQPVIDMIHAEADIRRGG